MSFVALHFASGAAFFTGSASLLVGLFFATTTGRSFWAAMGRFLLIVGTFFIAISATPLPWWEYTLWGLSLAFWIGSRFLVKPSQRLTRMAALALLVGCTGTATGFELWFQRAPRRMTGHWKKLVVIGDSLSAEDFTEGGEPWPTRLARHDNIRVVNLAFSGATAASAAKRVTPADTAGALVLLEIGGNDLLGVTGPAEFEQSLQRLLEKVCRPDTGVAMLELPLPPFYNRFGEIQRRLARHYNVTLIPRRCFASVFDGANATIDSLHLSPAGHEKMAAMISLVVLPSLIPIVKANQ